MSRSTRELIGEIINPRPRSLPGPHQPISVQPIVPVSALIGWTIGPPGARLAEISAAGVAAPANRGHSALAAHAAAVSPPRAVAPARWRTEERTAPMPLPPF